MSGQSTDFRNSRAIVGVAVTNIFVATLIYAANGANGQDCGLLRNTAWVALELFRSLLLVAHWTVASAYVYEEPRLLQHVFEMATTLVSLFSALAH